MPQSENPPGLQDLKHRLLKGGAWVASGFAVSTLAALVIGAMLTRLLPPEDVGLYFLAFSIVLTGSSVVQFGMTRAVVRLTAQSITNGNTGRARAVIFKSLLFVSISGLTLAILMGSGLGNRIASAIFENSRISQYLPILSIWLWATALKSVTAESFRGLHNIKMAALGQRILPNLLIAGFLATIWILGSSFSLSNALLLAAGSTFLVLAYTGTKLIRKTIAFPRYKELPLVDILRPSLPLFISQTLALVMAQAPIWILGATQPEDELATFGTAMRLAVLTSTPLLIVNNVIMPMTASLYTSNEHKKLARLLSISVTLVAIPSAVIFILFLVSGGEILSLLFGERYYSGASTLLILSSGYLLNVFAGSAAVTLAMTGNESRVLRSALVSSLLSVGSGLVLIPKFGSVGAAISASLGLIVYNAFLCWHCQKATNLRTYISLRGFRELFLMIGKSLKQA